jgi:hypothetical protein
MVAKQIWVNISDYLEIGYVISFESIAKYWLSNKKYYVINIFTSAALWGLWKLRNHLCFQDGRWKDVSGSLLQIANLIHS